MTTTVLERHSEQLSAQGVRGSCVLAEGVWSLPVGLALNERDFVLFPDPLRYRLALGVVDEAQILRAVRRACRGSSGLLRGGVDCCQAVPVRHNSRNRAATSG